MAVRLASASCVRQPAAEHAVAEVAGAAKVVRLEPAALGRRGDVVRDFALAGAAGQPDLAERVPVQHLSPDALALRA